MRFYHPLTAVSIDARAWASIVAAVAAERFGGCKKAMTVQHQGRRGGYKRGVGDGNEAELWHVRSIQFWPQAAASPVHCSGERGVLVLVHRRRPSAR